MRKFISFFLIFSLCLICGCRPVESDNSLITDSTATDTTNNEALPHDPADTEAPDKYLAEYLNNISNYSQPIQQIGSPTSYIHMDENLVIGIIYPETGVETLDSALEKWANDIADKYKNEMSGIEIADAAELHIIYESYKVGKSIVSVKMSGSFISPTMAHPIDIVKTFNSDGDANKLINASDVIKEDSLGDFIEMVSVKASIDKERVDDHILSNFLITNQGLEITFNRGEYFAMSEGTKVICFEYPEIASFLKDTFLLKEEEETTAEPETEAHIDETTTGSETESETAPATDSLPETTQPAVPQIDPTKPMIALTFDDGPSAHTDRLLDLFKEHGGKGTFFVVGYLIDSRSSTLKRIADDGHEIGNHSWDHKQLTTLDETDLINQLMMPKAKIYDITGIDCTIMRPPYGACNDFVKSVGAKLGITFVNWSVDTLDWKTKNAQAVYDEIIKNARDGDIVLCHDLHKTTVDAMELVIPKLIADGYQLVTVSELLSYSNDELIPGKMYYKK